MKVRVDSKVLTGIEGHVTGNHRCMFFVFGEKTKEKVPVLLHLTRRCVDNHGMMKLLWFQQRENNFSRKLEKKFSKKFKRSSKKEEFKNEDSFEMMVVSSDITYCGPGNCHKVLGQTYDACIFEDFKALNPNILARCIETVKGGGVIVFLLESFTSFDQLYQLEMDIHAKYKTDWFPEVKPRFNKRLVTSLKSCTSAFSVSDDFRINALCEQFNKLAEIDEDKNILSTIKSKMTSAEEIKPYLKLIEQCATLDQVAVVLEFVRLLRCSLGDKSVVSLTSGRGRGKSASLGLGLAVAILSGHSRIGVTSPSVENVQTLFHFACMGLDALGYKENVDYFIGRSLAEADSHLVKIEIKRLQKQIIEYRPPRDVESLTSVDLLCIDEAAAIPLNLTKKLLRAKTCIISSTIQGYEGTGRSLSLKLLEDLRRRSRLIAPLDLSGVPEMVKDAFKNSAKHSGSDASLTELTLVRCIRYSDNDPIEHWLDRLFCLSTSESVPTFSTPSLEQCQLYQVNLDALFSGNQTSEDILSSIIAVYVASHYKNSPNDLVMLADAPAHKLFCLLPRQSGSSVQVICVVQVAMEGNVRDESVRKFWEGGERPPGDLMGWIVDQQFPGQKFATRKGMRVVRIATHSIFQKMGFGKRAMELLIKHCQKNELSESAPTQNEEKAKFIFRSLDEADALSDIEHIGASFGASLPLVRFWKSLKMQPVYISQISNEVTGEHSCIFMRDLQPSKDKVNIQDMWMDFRLRFLRLLPHSFRFFDSNAALEFVISSQFKGDGNDVVTLSTLDKERVRNYMMDKLEMRAVFDLLHEVSRQFFISGNFCSIGHDKMMILLAVALQGKSFDEVASELNDAKHQRNKGKNTHSYDSSSIAGILNQMFKSLLEKAKDSHEKTKPVKTKQRNKRKKLSEE